MKIYKINGKTPNVEGSSDLYVGIDVHVKSWHVTILQDGAVLSSSSIPGHWEVLRKMLDRYKKYQLHVVYEAGYFGYSLRDSLVRYGAECIVTPPSLIPREYGNRVKTDRLDSRKLAVLCSQGLLRSIAVPTEEERAHRTVIRRRHQLVKDCIRIQSRIKAELHYYNIPFPEIHGRWTKRFVENLHTLRFTNEWVRKSFESLLTQYDQLIEQIDKQTRLIRELANTDRYREGVKILRTIPGIGILIAMEILVELYNIRRFRTASQLAAYVGLTPSQYSSGEHVRMGRITRIGKGQLRALLIEASWILIRKDPVIGQKYASLRYRAGSKKAIVAIARKLLVRARRVLLDGTPYVIGKAA
jgi:transposase